MMGDSQLIRQIRRFKENSNSKKYILPCNIPRWPRGGVKVQPYSFFNLGARWGRVVNATSRPLYPWEGDTVNIVKQVVWATKPV
jgi:hypothetical protein